MTSDKRVDHEEILRGHLVDDIYAYFRRVGMGARKKNPECAIRLNFFNQASSCVLEKVPGGAGKVVAAVMGHQLVMVGRKSQIRLWKEIKRRICKV